MNPAIGAFIGVSKQTEMLLMTVLALWVNIFDMAIFEISSNLDQVWNVEIDREIFNSNAEYVIRMLLSGVVLIRTFTLHLYIAFLIAVFWPVCFGTRPTLMLPWLVVSAIKNLGTGLVSIATGGYTCMIYGPLRPACVRFLLSQIIDLSPSFYMWFVGLSLYCDLKKPKSVSKLQVKAMEDQELNVALRRRKVKSMIDEDILRQQFESRSFQKKFLGTSAVEVNEFINRCSYDNLKNKFSRSLDSLLDVLTVQTELLDIEDSEPLEIDSSSTLQQKTAKLLGISMDEIDCIKQNRQTRTDFPAYPIQPQKKIPTISLINSRYESPAKLLPETSLYSPPNKPIRVTKSELKSAKDFPQMESVPEKEMQVLDLSQDESFESFSKMKTICPSNTSLFKPDAPTDDGATINDTKDYGNKNLDRSCRMQDRGNLEEVQVENPTKYKFSNTLSDKSHYLLDEYCFLFDKESMLKKAEQSKVVSVYAKKMRPNDQNSSIGKRRCLNAPNNAIDVATTIVTRYQDNAINKTSSNLIFDGKSENKNNKTNILRKTKEDMQNKKNFKLSERNQTMKKKISTKKLPSSECSNIPVFHRSHRNFEKTKNAINDRKDNIRRNWFKQENKLDTIEENRDSASLFSNQETKRSVSLIQDNEAKEKITPEFKLEENKNKNMFLKADKKSKEEQETAPVFNEEDRNKNRNDDVLLQDEENILTINEEVKNNIKNTSLNEENSTCAEEYKISVSAEIERLNKKNLNISSSPRNDLLKNVAHSAPLTVNQTEVLNRRNYLRSMEYGFPIPFIPIKYSSTKTKTPQKEAMKQIPKIFPKEENKFNKNKSSVLSEKIFQHIKEKKSDSKTEKIKAENVFEDKNNKTDLFKANNNQNEFEFTATPSVKSTSRNKQLEFHFKEKISKTRDYKMEDLFKKKVVADKKDSKTNEKDKSGFPSYFSNKINRMITDACQIRKKSCKKINLFGKVPANSNTKQRNKLSTVELFRKQTPPKTNIFDITKKRSIGQLEIPPFKKDTCISDSDKNEPISQKIQINLFSTEHKKPSTNPVVLLKSRPSSRQSIGKTINKPEEMSTVTKEESNMFTDMRNTESLINSFMSFKSNASSCEEGLSIPPVVKSDVIKTDELSEGDKVVKKTESPRKINLFNQKSNRYIAAQKCSLPTIQENKCCKKLSEQAMNKLMSLTKTDFKAIQKESNTNTASCLSASVGNFNCKKLSEQAINKIISLTNMSYSSISNKELKTVAIDNKLSDSKIYENCKKLSDFAIDKLLSITNQKYALQTNINDKQANFVTKIESEKKETDSLADIPDNSNNSITNKTDLNDITKEVKANQSEKNNSPHLNETPTKLVNNISVIKEDVKSLKCTTMENHEEIKPSMKVKCNTLVQIAKNNIPKKEDASEIVVSTDIFLTAPKLEENKNYSEAISVADNCNEYLNKSHSPNETMMSTKENINCKWISQDCVNKFASNTHSAETISPNEECRDTSEIEYLSISEIENEELCEENVQKEAYLNNSASRENNECNSNVEVTKEIGKEKIQHSIKLVDLAKKACKLKCQLKNQEETIISETPPNSLLSSNNCEFPETNQEEEKIPDTINHSSAENDEKTSNAMPLNNNEYQTNIPIIKIEKECKGTSQHRIQLISSTISNTNSKNVGEIISPKNANVIKIKRDCDGNSKNNNMLISSLLYETSYDSNIPIKEEKLCRGTSQHNIKLISSIRHDSASDTKLCYNENKLFSSTKDELSVPMKLQKVCKGSPHNYIKLISQSKDGHAKNSNFSHKETISNILKEYQTVPIMKEEKVCKGTSKHKIKLVSSYKKDAPSKINLFHSETEYKNDKNENITIIKEEKISEGTLEHSIKLISSSSLDTPNKTIFIVKKQLPKSEEKLPVTDDNVQKTSNTRPATQTNLFVNVNTANGKQNLTVIQKQNDDKEEHEVNVCLKDKIINKNEAKIKTKEKCNMKEDGDMESIRNISVIFNAIQGYLENDTEKLAEKNLCKKTPDLETRKNESNVNFVFDIKSSEILSSLIHKVETSIKQTNNEDALDEKPNEIKCPKYHANQIDFGCQTSTLSKRILDNNPIDLSNKLSRSKSTTKSSSIKSYQDLNLQKIAFSMTVNKSCCAKSETKTINEILSKDEKKDSVNNLSSRSSRNSSYVSIHKERLEKARSAESDLNKHTILPNCSFLEDGYTRLHNLLGVKHENFNIRTRKNLDSSFNF